MFLRPYHPERFLRTVYSVPFLDYCRLRNIPFTQAPSAFQEKEDFQQWTAALTQLSHEQHAQVELEFAKVHEMAGAEATAHLIEAADAELLPPDSVPGGAPLALWFLLHQPELFHEVFFHHEIQEVESWRTAQVSPHIPLPDPAAGATALRETLGEFFKLREGTGSFCIVDWHRFTEAVCFVAQVADRLQFLDVFTEAEQLGRHQLRPAISILFVYYPSDGTVLLKSHLLSRERTTELCQCFGHTVLNSPVSCDETAFDLDILKRPCHPLPDAEDIELVRVKSLHLRYPARFNRRELKLGTLTNDEADAIDQPLRTHLGQELRLQLRVCYAEIQVRLRIDGRSKNHLLRLWPNRGNLSQTALGQRFRTCLRRWGLSHAR